MERLVYVALLLAVYVHVTAKSGIGQASLLSPNLTTRESGIAQASLVSPNLTTAESGIAHASFVSPNLTTAELGIVQASTLRVLIEESNDMKKRGFKANEVANATSYEALSPSGPDPSHDYTNMSNTNLANSTSILRGH